MWDRAAGSPTCQNTRQGRQPSSLAASIRSLGSVRKNCRNKKTPNADQMVGTTSPA